MPKAYGDREERFSAAWQQVRNGRPVEDVVADGPEGAADLEPLLRLAQGVRAVPAPHLSEAGLARAQQYARRAAQARQIRTIRPVPSGRPWAGRDLRPPWQGAGRPTLQVRLVVLLALGLIPVALLLLALLMRPAEGPTQLLTYSGRINAMSATEWLVDDEQVLVDAHTEIHGRPAIGAEVVCIGKLVPPGSRLQALTVWVQAPQRLRPIAARPALSPSPCQVIWPIIPALHAHPPWDHRRYG